MNQNQKYKGYTILSTGYVLSSKNRKDRILKFAKNNRGYLSVSICYGIAKSYLIHRLVAETFIPNPYKKPCINHIDGDKANNHVSNLEWVTYQENTIHSYKTGLNTAATKFMLLNPGAYSSGT